MYSGPLYRVPFKPEQRALQHREVREEYTKRLREQQSVSPSSESIKPPEMPVKEREKPKSLKELLEMVSPEDSALIFLIVFLLCDNSNNDVVLLGILLYVLISK